MNRGQNREQEDEILKQGHIDVGMEKCEHYVFVVNFQAEKQ